MLGHAALRDQPADIVDIDLAPDALLPAPGVALEKTLFVKALADTVDPTPAEHDIDRLLGRDRLEPRTHLMDLDPDFVFVLMMRGEPIIKAPGIGEFVDLVRVDLERSHIKTASL